MIAQYVLEAPHYGSLYDKHLGLGMHPMAPSRQKVHPYREIIFLPGKNKIKYNF